VPSPVGLQPGQDPSVRDNEGFIRCTISAISFDDDIKGFHAERLLERARAEGRDVCFQMVTDDIYAISKGHLVGRPR
jgi:methylaspartate mutase epsilon subunit